MDSRGASPRTRHGASGETAGRPGAKHKTIHPRHTSMTDLKRRAGAILDFITRAQVELANDNFAPEVRSLKPTAPPLLKKPQPPPPPPPPPAGKDVPTVTAQTGLIAVNGEKHPHDEASGDADAPEWEGFEALNGVEMMDVLTTKLIRWQAEYGKIDK